VVAVTVSAFAFAFAFVFAVVLVFGFVLGFEIVFAHAAFEWAVHRVAGSRPHPRRRAAAHALPLSMVLAARLRLADRR